MKNVNIPWVRPLLTLLLVLLASCAEPAEIGGDIESFVEDGLSIVTFRDAVFVDGGEPVDYLTSESPAEIRLNMINPKRVHIAYSSIGYDNTLYGTFFDTPPSLDIPTENDHVILNIDPSLAAEHQTIELILTFVADELNKDFPPETIRFRVETPPHPVLGLIAGTTKAPGSRAMIAFRLPSGATDDDLENIEITWGPAGSLDTDTFSWDELTEPPFGETNLLGFEDPYNRYFYTDDAKSGDVCHFSVKLTDHYGRESEISGPVNSEEVKYNLYYDSNGATGGSAPDMQEYHYDDNAVIAGQPEGMIRDGWFFMGWNTRPDGSGDDYAEGDPLVMNTGNVILFAEWAQGGTASITFDISGTDHNTLASGVTGYTVYQGQTLVLTPTGSSGLTGVTSGWTWFYNGVIQPNVTGNSLSYTANGPSQNVISCTVAHAGILYSGSFLVTVRHCPTVSYFANGATGGTPPDPVSKIPGDDVTVSVNSGTLVKSGFAFNGWNTLANGQGDHISAGGSLPFTMPANSVILYAEWEDAAPGPVTQAGALAGTDSIILSWEDPPDADYDHVTITGPGGMRTVNKGINRAVYTGLSAYSTYEFMLTAWDTTADGTPSFFSDTVHITGMPGVAGTDNPIIINDIEMIMVFVPAKKIPTGVDDLGRAVIPESIWMQTTEMPSDTWFRVTNWALLHGYLFNSGFVDAEYPVRYVSIRDAMVWCNAFTEYYNGFIGGNLTCVYLTEEGGEPIRDIGFFSTPQTDPWINPEATGFRLPTTVEWELAARYIVDSNNDGDICDTREFYPGDFASGSDAPCTEANPVEDYDQNGYQWDVEDVSATILTNCGVKPANMLGLHDMSGNLWEYIYVTPSENDNWEYRRGTSFVSGNTLTNYQLGRRPDQEDLSFVFFGGANDIGFRVVRNGEALP